MLIQFGRLFEQIADTAKLPENSVQDANLKTNTSAHLPTFNLKNE
jgi:hypothetical protein